MDADQPGMEPEADARSRKLSKKRKNALTRPETVPSQGPKRPLGVREPPRQPNRPGNPPNPEPGPGALACCLGRNQREGFPSRQFWVKPDRLLGNPRDCALQGACGGPQVTVCRFCLTSDCNRVMVHRVVILFMAMTGLQPSARATADPRTVRRTLELLKHTAGRRRRCRRCCRRCRSFIAENARTRGQVWSVCTPCVQAIEADARQLEIAPALLRRCLVYRTDIAHLRASARTCADACRNVLSWILRCRRRPVL